MENLHRRSCPFLPAYRQTVHSPQLGPRLRLDGRMEALPWHLCMRASTLQYVLIPALQHRQLRLSAWSFDRDARPASANQDITRNSWRKQRSALRPNSPLLAWPRSVQSSSCTN